MESDRMVIHVRELILTRNGQLQFSMLTIIYGLTLSGFECISDYSILPDGTIELNHSILPQGNMPKMLPPIDYP